MAPAPRSNRAWPSACTRTSAKCVTRQESKRARGAAGAVADRSSIARLVRHSVPQLAVLAYGEVPEDKRCGWWARSAEAMPLARHCRVGLNERRRRGRGPVSSAWSRSAAAQALRTRAALRRAGWEPAALCAARPGQASTNDRAPSRAGCGQSHLARHCCACLIERPRRCASRTSLSRSRSRSRKVTPRTAPPPDRRRGRPGVGSSVVGEAPSLMRQAFSSAVRHRASSMRL